MEYSASLKATMVRRMSGPDAVSANALAEETGLSQTTLSRWLREAGGDKVSAMKRKKRPRDRSAEERLALLVQAAALREEDLGAFLRREGVHQAHLDEWRATALKALGESAKGKPKPEARQLRELKKELHRKEKALAEAAALLVLKKKSRRSGGTGTTTRI